MYNNHTYTAPSGNLKLFINDLDNIIKKNFIKRSKVYYMWYYEYKLPTIE